MSGVEDYLARLRGHGVEPDGEVAARCAILETARRLAREAGGSIESDADLAATLADLVEWPGRRARVLRAEFLELPEEVTTTAMRTHQKYLPVRGPRGPAPALRRRDGQREDREGPDRAGQRVGPERPARRRAVFLRRRTSASPSSRGFRELSRLSFQDRLGDYRQKTRAPGGALRGDRARRRAGPDLVEPAVTTAARLAKVDLTTQMVKEFTDLQGVVGGIYARREGYPDAVWKAIYDQYRPASAGDEPPREASGAVLSLADRFDTLAGFFSIGLLPTGSRDPYGLRRAAYGAVAIVVAQADGGSTGGRSSAGALSLYPAARGGPARRERCVAARDVLRGTASQLPRAPRPFLRRDLRRRRTSDVWDFADAADRARSP